MASDDGDDKEDGARARASGNPTVTMQGAKWEDIDRAYSSDTTLIDRAMRLSLKYATAAVLRPIASQAVPETTPARDKDGNA
jgi:hypothetical protein